MTADILLRNVQNAAQPEEIFTRMAYKKEYIAYIKLLHPDVCALPGATEAVEKLNAYKTYMDGLFTLEDDAGTMQIVDNQTIVFKGDQALLQKSLDNYNRLMRLTDASSLHFRQYLPKTLAWQGDELHATHTHRLVPLTHVTLPQEHVSWLLSRMFELVAWLHQSGFGHIGIHPESICVVPETHGIVCVSFYHLKPLGGKLETLAGKYLDWYPQITFDKKQAIPYIDLSLAQRTALYLLGDKSGNGVKLKRTCNEQLIDFLITPHYDSYATYDEYRKLLKIIFGKPKFHELKL